MTYREYVISAPFITHTSPRPRAIARGSYTHTYYYGRGLTLNRFQTCAWIREIQQRGGNSLVHFGWIHRSGKKILIRFITVSCYWFISLDMFWFLHARRLDQLICIFEFSHFRFAIDAGLPHGHMFFFFLLINYSPMKLDTWQQNNCNNDQYFFCFFVRLTKKVPKLPKNRFSGVA